MTDAKGASSILSVGVKGGSSFSHNAKEESTFHKRKLLTNLSIALVSWLVILVTAIIISINRDDNTVELIVDVSQGYDFNRDLHSSMPTVESLKKAIFWSIIPFSALLLFVFSVAYDMYKNFLLNVMGSAVIVSLSIFGLSTFTLSDNNTPNYYMSDRSKARYGVDFDMSQWSLIPDHKDNFLPSYKLEYIREDSNGNIVNIINKVSENRLYLYDPVTKKELELLNNKEDGLDVRK